MVRTTVAWASCSSRSRWCRGRWPVSSATTRSRPAAKITAALTLSDGSEIPWDDGKQKSAEERLEHPDVEDVFAQRYQKGPIRPITTSTKIPGAHAWTRCCGWNIRSRG